MTPTRRTMKELLAITPKEPPFNDECDCAEVIDLRTKLEEARDLITKALDFWSAPGIDMPDIDTFDDMVTFLEETGEPYKCKWDAKGKYTGEPTKPVGLTPEEHETRERFRDLLHLATGVWYMSDDDVHKRAALEEIQQALGKRGAHERD